MTSSRPTGAVPSEFGNPVEPVRAAARRGTAIKIIFALLVLGFGVFYIASRWSELLAALQKADGRWIAVALLLGAVGQWLAANGFRVLLQAVAPAPLPRLQVARIYFVSQLGKYVPGSIWPIVAVASMTRRFAVSARASATAGVLSLLFSVVAGSIIGSILTVIGAAAHHPGLYWLLIVPAAAVLVVQPRLIVPLVNRLLRLLRRPPVNLGLTPSVVRRAVGWPAVSWLFLGAQCWALIVALGGPVGASVAPAIGGFALAYVAGTLFIPAPGGIGVREAVLTFALSGVVGLSAGFGADSVVVVVLVSRVLLALLDFGQTGVILLLSHGSKDGVPTASKSVVS